MGSPAVVRILRTFGYDTQKSTPGGLKDTHNFDPVRKKVAKDAQNLRPRSPSHKQNASGYLFSNVLNHF